MNYRAIKIIVFSLFFSLSGFSQNGEDLFRANCSACHNIDSKSTGPALQGARLRWTENSTEEQFYSWILNSQKVIEDGDPYALSLFKEYNESVMTPQNITNEEIDAIFEYVENPPIKEAKGETLTFPLEPTYAEQDYTFIFWCFVLLTVILLIAIGSLASSIKTTIKSDQYKNRTKKESETEDGSKNLVKALLILIGLGSIPSQANAFSFDVTHPGGIIANQTDIWMLIGVNLLLIWLFVFLRKQLYGLLDEINPPKAKKKSRRQKRSALKVLTNIVPIEEEGSILMDHEYDGIRELDNDMPPWWLWGFYASIVFAFAYMTYYHVLDIGDSNVEAYNKEMAIAKLAKEDFLKGAAMNVDENSATIFTDASNLSSGAKIFKENCKVCHGDNGGGINGPNLTDNYWLYSNDIKSVFESIKYGRKEGDMPPHEEKLNPVQIQQVASFVLSLNYTEGQKGPEGILITTESNGLNTEANASDTNTIVSDTLTPQP